MSDWHESVAKAECLDLWLRLRELEAEFAALEAQHREDLADYGVNVSLNLRLTDEIERLKAAGAKVCEGFDKAIFVRGTSGDDDTAWAIRLMPYLGALAELAGDVAEHRREKLRTGNWEESTDE